MKKIKKKISECKDGKLDLSFNDITDQGVEYLSNWKGHTLDLSDNKITDQGAKYLSNWQGHTLDLFDNKITDHKQIENKVKSNCLNKLSINLQQYFIPDLTKITL